ncbi:AAA family ATPase [Candidatus Nitrosocosmicus arcticus]|uniref:Replication factor C large subunit n=1 Tax=Candidatus Nitrosocosmicus arcticus TaxID=2035267 RepID=A0A557SSP6_9ARCH|nr:AAA family ATPase [Candidatus Nitrosocosmicus arcticus]TVP39612.1 replication factor C large subunit [Candidatus Nitrosocosmicus arcticus]
MWIEKYRVSEFDSFFGNEKPRLLVLKWLKSWIKGTKPLLIIGPPGTGKTSFVQSLAKLLDFDLIELNASDLRNKINLETIINPILLNNSIFGKQMLLFLDEVDGISSRDDYGGMPFLSNILKNSDVPIIMASNSKSYKMKEIIKNSKLVEFRPLSSFASYMLLQNVMRMERQHLKSSEQFKIISQSRGDARTLLNTLQTKLEGDVDSDGSTGTGLSVEECINKFFTITDISEAKQILITSSIRYSTPKYGFTSEERNKDFLNALYTSIVSSERNIPSNDLANMLDKLSEIDLFVNRIYEKRNWSLLRYANDLLLQKLFRISRDKGIEYNQYSVPFSLMGPIFMRGQSLRPLRTELSKIFHTSISKIGLLYYSNFIMILKNLAIQDLDFDNPDSLKFNEVINKEIEKQISKTKL